MSTEMNAERIRAIRKLTGMSMRDLASHIGLTGAHAADTVRRWCSGSQRPGPETIEKLKALEDQSRTQSGRPNWL